MSIHHSIAPGVLYEQPGTKITCDNEGKWTATVNYLCSAASFARMCPRVGSKFPSIPFISLSSVESTITEGDLAEITCNYTGVEDALATDENGNPVEEEDPAGGEGGGGNPSPEKANATYTMGLALSEEPLLSHDRYKGLTASERETLRLIASGKDKDDQKNLLRDKVTSVRGLEALAKIDRGQTTYYSPKITWRESWVRKKSAPANELNTIGKINIPNGPCPALGGGRTWLRNGVTQTQEGKVFRVEIEWLSSNPGGWDTDIYS